MGLIIVVQKSLNKAGIETMNKMRVINRQTGDIFNVKVNPYLPSKAYQAIEKNNPLGYILKGNMLKLTIPFFWAVQSIWLLSFKSIETFIAAIILLLISFLGIVIKSNTYNIIFLGICFLYSVALGLIMFLLFLFFELPMIYILVPIMNFIVLVYMLRKYGRR